MIAKMIQVRQKADHGPVRLIYRNDEGVGAPDEPLAQMIGQDFNTVLDALRYARFRLDDADFNHPGIWDNEHLVLDYDAIQMFADDPSLLAVHLAGLTSKDLGDGKVELRHLSLANLYLRQPVFSNLRTALLALSSDREDGAWIFHQEQQRPIMSPQTLMPVLDYLHVEDQSHANSFWI
jgi:hypothetical protein